MNFRENTTVQLERRKLKELPTTQAGRKGLPKETSPPQDPPQEEEKEEAKFLQQEEPGLQTSPSYC